MEKYLKNKLTPILWKGFSIKPTIRKRLLAIAKSFYEEMHMDAKIKDIILAGSSCNYNYHPGSDIDLHLVVDYTEINQDKSLVSKYLKEIKDNWNNQHNIKIQGMDIEISIQDSDPEEGKELKSAGVFSLLDNTWITRPDKKTIDSDILTKRDKLSKEYAKEIADLETIFRLGKFDYNILYKDCLNIWKKIKELRKIGLKESGEYDPHNLTFKKLRDDGFIEKLVDLKNKIYDNFYSK